MSFRYYGSNINYNSNPRWYIDDKKTILFNECTDKKQSNFMRDKAVDKMIADYKKQHNCDTLTACVELCKNRRKVYDKTRTDN